MLANQILEVSDGVEKRAPSTLIIDHDITELERLVEGLKELRSRLPWVAEVLKEPSGLGCFICTYNELVPAERAEEATLRVLYKPTALYQKLLAATIETDDPSVIVV